MRKGFSKILAIDISEPTQCPLSNIYKFGPIQTIPFIIFSSIFILHNGDVLSEALYAIKLKANGPVIMNTTKAAKPAISSHKLHHARQFLKYSRECR